MLDALQAPAGSRWARLRRRRLWALHVAGCAPGLAQGGWLTRRLSASNTPSRAINVPTDASNTTLTTGSRPAQNSAQKLTMAPRPGGLAGVACSGAADVHACDRWRAELTPAWGRHPDGRMRCARTATNLELSPPGAGVHRRAGAIERRRWPSLDGDSVRTTMGSCVVDSWTGGLARRAQGDARGNAGRAAAAPPHRRAPARQGGTPRQQQRPGRARLAGMPSSRPASCRQAPCIALAAVVLCWTPSWVACGLRWRTAVRAVRRWERAGADRTAGSNATGSQGRAGTALPCWHRDQEAAAALRSAFMQRHGFQLGATTGGHACIVSPTAAAGWHSASWLATAPSAAHCPLPAAAILRLCGEVGRASQGQLGVKEGQSVRAGGEGGREAPAQLCMSCCLHTTWNRGLVVEHGVDEAALRIQQRIVLDGGPGHAGSGLTRLGAAVCALQTADVGCMPQHIVPAGRLSSSPQQGSGLQTEMKGGCSPS
jgi:hypothetical protein